MRLLNVHERQLGMHYKDIPPYAILSHTWDQTADEVSYDDMKKTYHASMPGYKKIDLTCRQAIEDKIDWVWIDSCCIDKSNSVELSEAINSMYRWYEKSEICYVYLSDVTKREVDDDADSAFKKCRWFSRGWTLQELLAPKKLEFYDATWTKINDRASLAEHIEKRTSIPARYLVDKRRDFRQARVAQRLSWASDRETTREEDMAYCLLGIFDLNIPLLYGEGDKAFRRLQEAILKTSVDDSILAWRGDSSLVKYAFRLGLELGLEPGLELGLEPALAPSPRAFRLHLHRPMARVLGGPKFCDVTSRGIRLELPVYPLERTTYFVGLLNATVGPSIDSGVSAVLLRPTAQPSEYDRVGYFVGNPRDLRASLHTICIRHTQSEDTATDDHPLHDRVNWVSSGHFIVMVAPSLDDKILATEHFWARPASRATNPGGWTRMGVHLASTSGPEYFLIIERQELASAIWFSADFLSQPIICRLLNRQGTTTLQEALHSRVPSKDSPFLPRRAKQSDTRFFGRYMCQVEIDSIDDITAGSATTRVIDRLLSASAPVGPAMVSTTVAAFGMTLAMGPLLRARLIAEPAHNASWVLFWSFHLSLLRGVINTTEFLTLVALGLVAAWYVLLTSQGNVSKSARRKSFLWNLWCAWCISVGVIYTVLFFVGIIPYTNLYLFCLIDFFFFWVKFVGAVVSMYYPIAAIRQRVLWKTQISQPAIRSCVLFLSSKIRWLFPLYNLLTELTQLHIFWTILWNVLSFILFLLRILWNTFWNLVSLSLLMLNTLLGLASLGCVVWCIYNIGHDVRRKRVVGTGIRV